MAFLNYDDSEKVLLKRKTRELLELAEKGKNPCKRCDKRTARICTASGCLPYTKYMMFRWNRLRRRFLGV